MLRIHWRRIPFQKKGRRHFYMNALSLLALVLSAGVFTYSEARELRSSVRVGKTYSEDIFEIRNLIKTLIQEDNLTIHSDSTHTLRIEVQNSESQPYFYSYLNLNPDKFLYTFLITSLDRSRSLTFPEQMLINDKTGVRISKDGKIVNTSEEKIEETQQVQKKRGQSRTRLLAFARAKDLKEGGEQEPPQIYRLSKDHYHFLTQGLMDLSILFNDDPIHLFNLHFFKGGTPKEKFLKLSENDSEIARDSMLRVIFFLSEAIRFKPVEGAFNLLFDQGGKLALFRDSVEFYAAVAGVPEDSKCTHWEESSKSSLGELVKVWSKMSIEKECHVFLGFPHPSGWEGFWGKGPKQ